jgi:D-alanyl-D-alanine carboxypeptidase (penicillin-binding protein 5/6)
MGIEAAKQSDGFRLRENGNLALLEWGFRFFEAHTLYAAGKKIEAQTVWKGQAIGKLRVSLDGKVLAERPLVALNAVEEAGFFGRLWDELWMWWESD